MWWFSISKADILVKRLGVSEANFSLGSTHTVYILHVA